MTATAVPASTRPGAPNRRSRGEGQWALGHREPLNPNERVQEGRQPAQRPGPDREHLRAPRVRQHRPRRPSRPVPLVRPVHAARPRHRRRPDRRSSSRRSSTTSTSCCAIRIDGGQLNVAQLRAIANVSERVRRGTPPTSPTGRTSSCTGSGSRTCRRSGVVEGVGLQHHRGVRGLPAGRSSAARSPASPRRDHRRDRGDPRRSTRATSATRSSPTCRASSSPRSPGCRAYAVRGERHLLRRRRSTPTTARASTCGSAAACPPTRCSPSGLAPGCRCTRFRTCGRAWSGSSATTGTAGCATAPG